MPASFAANRLSLVDREAASHTDEGGDTAVEEATDPAHEHRQVIFTPELVARTSTRRPG